MFLSALEDRTLAGYLHEHLAEQPPSSIAETVLYYLLAWK